MQDLWFLSTLMMIHAMRMNIANCKFWDKKCGNLVGLCCLFVAISLSSLCFSMGKRFISYIFMLASNFLISLHLCVGCYGMVAIFIFTLFHRASCACLWVHVEGVGSFAVLGGSQEMDYHEVPCKDA